MRTASSLGCARAGAATATTDTTICQRQRTSAAWLNHRPSKSELATAARHEKDQGRRAERGGYDADRELTAWDDQPGERVASDEQCGAHAQRHGQQHAVTRAEQAAHQVRDDQADERNRPAPSHT